MYDLNEIKNIPLREVAQLYNINVDGKGNKLWGKLRAEERTASFVIDTIKNKWRDYGVNEGGTTIDFVMYIEGVSCEIAVNRLASNFGIINNAAEKVNKWAPLTDNQYVKIGIQPRLATMNFNYDLTKQSIEQLKKWNDKYFMSVPQLAERYPDVYNRMIDTIAVKKISYYRDIYYDELKQQKYIFKLENSSIINVLKEDVQRINKMVDLLKRAVTISTKSYDNLKVNIEKDIQNLPKEVLEDHEGIQIMLKKGDLILDKSGNYGFINDIKDGKYECFAIDYIKPDNLSFTDIIIDTPGKNHGLKSQILKCDKFKYIDTGTVERVLGSLDKKVEASVLKKLELFKFKNLVSDGSNNLNLVMENTNVHTLELK